MELCEFIDPDPAWVSQQIHGARIFSPNETPVTIHQQDAGYVIERKVFDRRLTELAADAGAEIMVKARVTGVTSSAENTVNGVTFRYSGREYTCKTKVVIAADGVESQVGRWAGIDTTHQLRDVAICAQYLISNIELIPEYLDFYVGHEKAPRGYLWVFPKGDDIANVGIGIRGSISGKGNKLAIDYLNEFVKRKFPEGKILGLVCGAVPVGYGLPQIVGDGILLIGDAAHHSDPCSGGGIPNAMFSGKYAAEAAVEGINKGDVSEKILSSYADKWDREKGKNFKRICRIRDCVLKYSDEMYDEYAEVLSKVPGEEMTLSKIFQTLLRHQPSLLLELRHLILAGWV